MIRLRCCFGVTWSAKILAGVFAWLSLPSFAKPSVGDRQGVDVDLLVEAIRVVENSPRAKIGAVGERGPWQMRPEVWGMFSKRPLWWASSDARDCVLEQRAAAGREVVWILDRLALLGLPRSAWSVGLVHNAGFGIVRRRAWLRRNEDFAERVENVYGEFTAKALRR